MASIQPSVLALRAGVCNVDPKRSGQQFARENGVSKLDHVLFRLAQPLGDEV
jgi:hypothetical protein